MNLKNKVACLLVLILTIATYSTAMAANYTVTRIDPFGGNDGSYAMGINSSGQVVGYASTGSYSETHAFIYDNGVMQDLGTLGGGFSYAYGINDNGQAVGRSISTANGSYQYNAFLYSNTNGMQDLGALGGSSSQGNSINNSGNIAGNYVDANGKNRAFLYDNGVMQDLGSLLTGESLGAYGVNENNQVAGITAQLNGLTSPTHAFLYGDGSAEDLNRGLFSAVAYDINDLGQVVGRSWPNSIGQAYLFDNDGSNQNLGALEANGQSQAVAINNNGQVVGWSSNGSSPKSAFLYENGNMLELCVLVDCTAYGWDFFEEATGINDNGDIVGYGSFGGVTRAFVVSAVPVPAGAWLFASGLLGLFSMARRKNKA